MAIASFLGSNFSIFFKIFLKLADFPILLPVFFGNCQSSASFFSEKLAEKFKLFTNFCLKMG